MNASITGAIRPISDRIQNASLLADAATGLIEKYPSPAAIENAAKALIQAGLTLLGDSAETVYMVPDRLQSELHGAIVTAASALTLAIASDKLDGETEAVISLVRDSLEGVIERFDISELQAVDFEGYGHV